MGNSIVCKNTTVLVRYCPYFWSSSFPCPHCLSCLLATSLASSLGAVISKQVAPLPAKSRKDGIRDWQKWTRINAGMLFSESLHVITRCLHTSSVCLTFSRTASVRVWLTWIATYSYKSVRALWLHPKNRMSGKPPIQIFSTWFAHQDVLRLRPGQQGYRLTTSYVPATVVVTVTLPCACCRGTAGKRGGCAGRPAACAIARKRNGHVNANQHVREPGVFRDVATCSVLG